jgi:anti-anti-sigma factor
VPVAWLHGVERADDTVRVVLAGELDLNNADGLRAELAGALASEPAAVEVDLGEVTFIDSSIIGALVAARQSATARGSAVYVTRPTGQVSKVLAIMGLLEILTRR